MRTRVYEVDRDRLRASGLDDLDFSNPDRRVLFLVYLDILQKLQERDPIYYRKLMFEARDRLLQSGLLVRVATKH